MTLMSQKVHPKDPAKVHRGENLINVHSINSELNYYIFKPCFAHSEEKKLQFFKAKKCFPFSSFLIEMS